VSGASGLFYFSADDAVAGEPRRLATLTAATGALQSFVPVQNVYGLLNTPLWIGGVSSGAPGRVPDGSGGSTPLRVNKGPAAGQNTLQWGASCSASATNYAVYRGTLGTWYSHTPALCSTGGATTAALTPPAGNSYYLIVATASATEGSFGTDSAGAEIPAGASPCFAPRDLSTCGGALSESGEQR
jgi:hypothetical protein